MFEIGLNESEYRRVSHSLKTLNLPKRVDLLSDSEFPQATDHSVCNRIHYYIFCFVAIVGYIDAFAGTGISKHKR